MAKLQDITVPKRQAGESVKDYSQRVLDRLQNEIAYQKQARPKSTAVAALEWSLAEIERLRADNKRLRKQCTILQQKTAENVSKVWRI